MQAIERVASDVGLLRDEGLPFESASTQRDEADDAEGLQEILGHDYWEDDLDTWNVLGAKGFDDVNDDFNNLKDFGRSRTISVDSGLDVEHLSFDDLCSDIGELSESEDEFDELDSRDDNRNQWPTSLIGALFNMSKTNLRKLKINDTREETVCDITSETTFRSILQNSSADLNSDNNCYSIGNKDCHFNDPEEIFGEETYAPLDDSDLEQLLNIPECDDLETDVCKFDLLDEETILASSSLCLQDEENPSREKRLCRLLTDDSGFGDGSFVMDGNEEDANDAVNEDDVNEDEDDVKEEGECEEDSKKPKDDSQLQNDQGCKLKRIPRRSDDERYQKDQSCKLKRKPRRSVVFKPDPPSRSPGGRNDSPSNEGDGDDRDNLDDMTPYYCPPPVRRRRDSGVSLSGDMDIMSHRLVRQASLSEAACSDCLSWYNPETATDEETEIALQVLCAERLTQMTKTYNDIEAVTRLLEEKERDLELAARIGTTLLEKNKELSARNEELEDQISEANEKVNQLKHEVAMKDALLQIYIQDYDASPSSPVSESSSFGLPVSGFDNLQKKVKALEEENKDLRQETLQLQYDTDELEEREAALVGDVLQQYNDCKSRLTEVEEDVIKKGEINLRLQEDKTQLQTEIIDLEAKIRKMTAEHMEVNAHLKAAQASQKELTTEVGELTDKYHECMGLLHEAQEEVKALRRKAKPNVVHQHIGMMSPFHPEGSLAFELEDTMRKEIPYPEGYSPHDRKLHNRRIMETAKVVKKSNRKSSSLLSIPGSTPSSTGNDSCESIAGSSNRSSLYLSDPESSMLSESGDFDSLFGSSSLGKPGIPGSNDLETALRRLSIRKANEINEKILEEEEEKTLNKAVRGLDMLATPATGSHTPDSLLSLGSDFSKFSGYSGLNFHIPEKLQIVKPMEGSMTLHQWQRLATPHLGCFMDARPGVQNKGERPLEIDEEVYNLSDLEEDSPDDYITPNKVDGTFGTYTYTTSKIMHPTVDFDNTCVTQVYKGGPRLSSTMGVFSSRDTHTDFGTSTFSMNSSLARVLQEREETATPVQTKLDVAPPRFHSIVTETLSECRHSQTEAIYSTAYMATPQFLGIGSHTALSMIITDSKMLKKDLHTLMGSPKKVKEKDVEALLPIDPNTPLYIDGISDTAQPMVVADTFNLVKKLKSSGLEKAGSTTAAQAVLDTGLNSIMSFAGNNMSARVHQVTPPTSLNITSSTLTSSSGVASSHVNPSNESQSKSRDSYDAFSDFSSNKVSVSSLSEPLLRHLAGLQSLGSGILGAWRGSETTANSTSDDTSKQIESSL